MKKRLPFMPGSIVVLTALVACGSPPGLVAQPAANTTATLPAPQETSVPGCSSPAQPTVAETEGPFYKPNSPERAVLYTAGMAGTKLVLTGYVLSTDCRPVAHALLDFWQADATGQYDNTGFGLRGHQYTDPTGRYTLTTIIPGLYPGRTEHIHVKVQAPNGPLLTTQLFFPGVAENDTDGIFDRSLLIRVQAGPAGATGTYTFIVSTQ